MATLQWNPVSGLRHTRQADPAQAADDLILRMQQVVADQLPPDSGISSEEAYGELIEELETAPEIDTIREALGESEPRFGAREHPFRSKGSH